MNILHLADFVNHSNSLWTFSVLMGYLWACVVSLFQIIFIVNSKEYRALYGDNPLRMPPKLLNKPPKTAKIERVKFFPSPNFNKESDKLKLSPKIDKYDRHPFGIAQSQRIQNEYNEIRRNYLSQSHYYGHGMMNSQLWSNFLTNHNLWFTNRKQQIEYIVIFWYSIVSSDGKYSLLHIVQHAWLLIVFCLWSHNSISRTITLKGKQLKRISIKIICAEWFRTITLFESFEMFEIQFSFS